jgi:hypothetical protein
VLFVGPFWGVQTAYSNFNDTHVYVVQCLHAQVFCTFQCYVMFNVVAS